MVLSLKGNVTLHITPKYCMINWVVPGIPFTDSGTQSYSIDGCKWHSQQAYNWITSIIHTQEENKRDQWKSVFSCTFTFVLKCFISFLVLLFYLLISCFLSAQLLLPWITFCKNYNDSYSFWLLIMLSNFQNPLKYYHLNMSPYLTGFQSP